MDNALAALCSNGADDVRVIALHVHVIWKKNIKRKAGTCVHFSVWGR